AQRARGGRRPRRPPATVRRQRRGPRGPRRNRRAIPLRPCRRALKVVADTGPLVAAANRRDRAHELAAALVTELGRQLLVPEPVIVEVDQLLRSRVSSSSARLFLDAIAAGEHTVVVGSPALQRRAAAIDAQFADLGLGYV